MTYYEKLTEQSLPDICLTILIFSSWLLWIQMVAQSSKELETIVGWVLQTTLIWTPIWQRIFDAPVKEHIEL